MSSVKPLNILKTAIVITGGIPIAARSTANFLKVHKCDGSMKELMKIQEERFNASLGPSLVNS